MGKKVVIIILAILIIDQIVKVWVKTTLGAPGLPQPQIIPVIEGVFNIHYVENPGMAFGTTLGNGNGPKYILSLFRLVAIIAIGIYIFRLLKDPKVHNGLVYAMGLIFAGAAGNLIDGMFYDLIWDINPDHRWNWVLDDQEFPIIQSNGDTVTRDGGFLLGRVVDMFQFSARWPSYFPKGMAGTEMFGAIWNIADASISFGVALIILRYRSFFGSSFVKKNEDGEPVEDGTPDTISKKRWAIYFTASIAVFFLVLIGGSHIWYKIYDSVDGGMMAIAAIVIAFSSYWVMREYIK